MSLLLAAVLAGAYLAQGLQDLRDPGPYYDELYQKIWSIAV